MDGLFSLIVVVFYIAIALGSNKKKKDAKRAQRQRKRRAAFEQTVDRIEQAVEEMTREAPVQRKLISMQKKHGASVEGEDPCHEEMLGRQRPAMHVPHIDQARMAAAGEGEDPCHLGGVQDDMEAFAEVSPVARSPIFDTEDPEAFARDVLRGVVMSEILTRPGERRGAAGMKRGA